LGFSSNPNEIFQEKEKNEMSFLKETKYDAGQIRKDLTWEEAKKLPLYISTPKGNVWEGDRKVSSEEISAGNCYIANVSGKDILLYFFEKGEFNGMKGVRLHLIRKRLSKAKSKEEISVDATGAEPNWIFITPDWKAYDKQGEPISAKSHSYGRGTGFGYYEISDWRKYSHDLRITGEFKETPYNEKSEWLSPASVEILKEAGFDMETRPVSNWELRCDYCTEAPDDSYSIEWFVGNLLHPNRINRRKKMCASLLHDYRFYDSFLGGRIFGILTENDQAYGVFHLLKEVYKSNAIIVFSLKMQGKKDIPPFLVTEKGSKTISSEFMLESMKVRPCWFSNSENLTAEEILKELVSHESSLERTEVFKNLIPLLKETLKEISVKGEPSFDAICNLLYLLTPNGQKDRVFEETLKENGFEEAMSASDFLGKIAWNLPPNLKKKTPYSQVGLPKKMYYELKRLPRGKGETINLGGIIQAISPRSDRVSCTNSKERKEAYKPFLDFCSHADPAFLDAFAEFSARVKQIGGRFMGREDWATMFSLGGGDPASPVSAKIKTLGRSIRKMPSDNSNLKGLLDYEWADYYRQIEELSPLGLDWPKRYEAFSSKNVAYFLKTVKRRFPSIVDNSYALTENDLMSAPLEKKMTMLHALQNLISSENELEIEKAEIAGLDNKYAPWRAQLAKSLSWKGKDLEIIIPESLAELTREGRLLCHCVGSYKQDVAAGKEGILFLRKLSSPQTPFFTIDVVKKDGKFSVRQCHGKCNSNPTPEIVEALKQWAKATGKIDESSISSAYRALCHL